MEIENNGGVVGYGKIKENSFDDKKKSFSIIRVLLIVFIIISIVFWMIVFGAISGGARGH